MGAQTKKKARNLALASKFRTPRPPNGAHSDRKGDPKRGPFRGGPVPAANLVHCARISLFEQQSHSELVHVKAHTDGLWNGVLVLVEKGERNTDHCTTARNSTQRSSHLRRSAHSRQSATTTTEPVTVHSRATFLTCMTTVTPTLTVLALIRSWTDFL